MREKVDYNFLNFSQQEKHKNFISWLLKTTLGLLVLFGVLTYIYVVKVGVYKRLAMRKDDLLLSLDKLSKLADKKNRLYDEKDALLAGKKTSKKFGHENVINTLRQLGELVPKDLYLDFFEINTRNQIEIGGCSHCAKSLARALEEMNKDSRIKDCGLREANVVDGHKDHKAAGHLGFKVFLKI